MDYSEFFQEKMNEFSLFKMKLRKERISSTTEISKAECDLVREACAVVDKLYLVPLSRKDEKLIENGYLDAICSRKLTSEQISFMDENSHKKFSYFYVKHRMITDNNFIDNLLAELKANGNDSKYLAYSGCYYGNVHLNMAKLSEYALDNFIEQSIPKDRYANIMISILKHSKDALKKNNNNQFYGLRKGGESILDFICMSNINLFTHAELLKAYKGLEDECVNLYAKSLRSKREKFELTLQKSSKAIKES